MSHTQKHVSKYLINPELLSLLGFIYPPDIGQIILDYLFRVRASYYDIKKKIVKGEKIDLNDLYDLEDEVLNDKTRKVAMLKVVNEWVLKYLHPVCWLKHGDIIDWCNTEHYSTGYVIWDAEQGKIKSLSPLHAKSDYVVVPKLSCFSVTRTGDASHWPWRHMTYSDVVPLSVQNITIVSSHSFLADVNENGQEEEVDCYIFTDNRFATGQWALVLSAKEKDELKKKMIRCRAANAKHPVYSKENNQQIITQVQKFAKIQKRHILLGF